MKLYIPKQAYIDSSNIAASAYPAWVSTGTYAATQRCSYQAAGDPITREYESTTGGNIGNTPIVGGSAWWTDLGAQNRDRLIDNRNNTRTEFVTTGKYVVVRPWNSLLGTCKFLALTGLRNVASVTVKQFSNAGLTTLLSTQDITLFSTLNGLTIYKKSVIVDLPGDYSMPYIQILFYFTVSSPNKAECAQCFICDDIDFGTAEEGASPGIVSYSSFDPDQFGNYNYVARQNVRELNCTTWVSTANLDAVYQALEQYEASLVLVDANHSAAVDSTTFDALRVYGKITSIRIGLRYALTPIDIRVLGLD